MTWSWPTGRKPTALAVRADIAADSGRLSRARLDVAAGAAAGGLAGRRRRQPRRATARGGLRGRRPGRGAGCLPAGSYRVADYAAEIVATARWRRTGRRGGEADDRALADELGLRKAEVSGVNLDEELSRLVLYQQAYSVSARLVSITNELFDDLLAIAG